MSLAALGFRNSFRKPLRTGLSVAGIALCIVLIVTVAAVSSRYTDVVDQSYSIYKADLLVVSKATILLGGLPLGGVLSESTADQISGLPGVTSATPLLVVVDVNELVPTNITIGVPLQNFSMFGGATTVRLDGTYPSTADQVVVGEYLASTSGLTVGSTLRKGNASLTVTGILDTSNLVLSSAVIMPLQTAQLTQGYEGLVSAVLVDTAGPPSTVQGRIENAVAGVAALEPGKTQSFTEPLLSSVSSLDYALGSVSGILAILFVTLIVGVNILDQRDELATVTAIGASSGSTLKVTLTETAFTAFAGVALGLVLSVPSTALVFHQYAAIPLSIALSNALALLPVATALTASVAVVAAGLAVGALTTYAVVRRLG